MTTSLQWELQKLDKYHSKDSLSPIICAAIVLNPDMSWFFELEWADQPNWTAQCHFLVRQLWENSYQGHAIDNLSPEPTPTIELLHNVSQSYKRID